MITLHVSFRDIETSAFVGQNVGRKLFLSVSSDLELKPVGILEVKLIQATDLMNKDIIGKSDPYGVLYIRPLPDRMKRSKTIVSVISIYSFS